MMFWIVCVAAGAALWLGGAQRIGPRWTYAALGIAGLVGFCIFGFMSCVAVMGVGTGQLSVAAMAWPQRLVVLSIALGFGGMAGSTAFRSAAK